MLTDPPEPACSVRSGEVGCRSAAGRSCHDRTASGGKGNCHRLLLGGSHVLDLFGRLGKNSKSESTQSRCRQNHFRYFPLPVFKNVATGLEASYRITFEGSFAMFNAVMMRSKYL